eukprot:g17513.t1
MPRITLGGTLSQVQRAQMKEMQTDASAITVGFLLAQAFCYAMSQAEETEKKFIPILHGYPSEFVEHCTWILTGTATALLIFSATRRMKLCGCLGNFVFDYIGVLASVTGCWCLQRAGMIFLFHRFAGSAEQLGEGMATNRANIVNAFLMSLVSVICVLVNLGKKRADWKAAEEATKAAIDKADKAIADAQAKVADHSSKAQQAHQAMEQAEAAKAKALEEALMARKVAEEAKVAEHEALSEMRQLTEKQAQDLAVKAAAAKKAVEEAQAAQQKLVEQAQMARQNAEAKAKLAENLKTHGYRDGCTQKRRFEWSEASGHTFHCQNWDVTGQGPPAPKDSEDRPTANLGRSSGMDHGIYYGLTPCMGSFQHVDNQELETLKDDIDACCHEVAEALKRADVLLLCAGAGFSADSGLPTYEELGIRGRPCDPKVVDLEGDLGLKYDDICRPEWMTHDPEIFYGFWGSCYNDYRDTQPHEGYSILRSWRDARFNTPTHRVSKLIRVSLEQEQRHSAVTVPSRFDGTVRRFRNGCHTECRAETRSL